MQFHSNTSASLPVETLGIEKKVEHAHGEDSVIVVGRLNHVAHKDDFFETVRHLDKRSLLLLLLIGIGQVQS